MLNDFVRVECLKNGRVHYSSVCTKERAQILVEVLEMTGGYVRVSKIERPQDA